MKNRQIAAIVGALYIVGTVSGVLSLVATGPVLGASDYLARIAADGSPLAAGALAVLIMGLALAMVPVVIFPVLREHSQTLAIGYVVFRGGLETVTYIANAISLLLLLPVSRAFVQAGASNVASYQALGTMLTAMGDTCTALTDIVFPLGALMLYSVFFRSGLIPRWISGWGLVAAVLYLIGGLQLVFGQVSAMDTSHLVLVLPMGPQEMVMAVWLIVKGFNPSVVAVGSARVRQAEA